VIKDYKLCSAYFITSEAKKDIGEGNGNTFIIINIPTISPCDILLHSIKNWSHRI